MSKTESKPKAVEEMSFEEAYAELEKLVAAMEDGEAALEASLEAFVRGQELVKRCAALLDEAELKVKQLSGGVLIDPEEPS